MLEPLNPVEYQRPSAMLVKPYGPDSGRVGTHCWCLLAVWKMTPTKGAFRRLRKKHDHQTIKSLDKLLTLRKRCAKASEKKKWLSKCLDEGIYPANVLDRLWKPSDKAAQMMMKKDVTKLSHEIESLICDMFSLNNALNYLDFYSFSLFSKYSARVIKKVRVEFIDKVSRIVIDHPLPFNNDNSTNDDRVVNLSQYNLSGLERFALSFGEKFCIPSRRITPVPLMSKFESLYQQLEELKARSSLLDGLLRSRLSVLCREISNGRPSGVLSPMTSEHLQALNTLMKNEDIVITRADKGGNIVILNKKDYVEKVMNILEDPKRFRLCPKQKDLSEEVLKELRSINKKAQSKEEKGYNLCQKLIPVGCTIPRLYGLPKVHKQGVPVRPILSMSGSATHETAKFLVSVLRPVEAYFCKYNIKDSFELTNQLASLSISENAPGVIGSLDIVSLYTSVPLDECLKVIDECIKSGKVEVTIDRQLLLDLLSICVKNVQFLFNGSYYLQTDGVAMGSPLGPILANIFVGYIESQVDDAIKENAWFYRRYVDDILVIAKSEHNITKLHEKLNSANNNIRFTIELENNRSLPFLDVLIERQPDRLLFGWYHKDNWSGVLLHFNSFVPVQWKRGLLKGFKYRILNICSPEKLMLAMDELTNVFQKNGYPMNFIQEYFLDYIPHNKVKKNSDVSKKPVYICLPFLGDHRSQIWSMKLERYVSQTYPMARVITIWKTKKAFCSNSKDRLQPDQISGVVYHYRCPCSSDYVGRTESQLGVRIKQHIPKWISNGQGTRPRSIKQPNSAITRHLMQCEQQNNNPRSNFKILHKGHNSFMNRILEALEIKCRKPVLCVQKEMLYQLKIPWV